PAERILSPARVLLVPGGRRRTRARRVARSRRQLPVGERLPAPRRLVAALRRRDRAPDGAFDRRIARQDPRAQRRAALRPGRARHESLTRPDLPFTGGNDAAPRAGGTHEQTRNRGRAVAPSRSP